MTETRPGHVLPDARRQTASSPHPCRTYGVAPPAQRLDSTALSRRSLIRMRPLVQVQPRPQTRPLASENAGHCALRCRSNRIVPFGMRPLRALPRLSRNKPLSSLFAVPPSGVGRGLSVAQRCRTHPLLSFRHQFHPRWKVPPSWAAPRHGAVAAAGAGSQLRRQVLTMCCGGLGRFAFAKDGVRADGEADPVAAAAMDWSAVPLGL